MPQRVSVVLIFFITSILFLSFVLLHVCCVAVMLIQWTSHNRCCLWNVVAILSSHLLSLRFELFLCLFVYKFFKYQITIHAVFIMWCLIYWFWQLEEILIGQHVSCFLLFTSSIFKFWENADMWETFIHKWQNPSFKRFFQVQALLRGASSLERRRYLVVFTFYNCAVLTLLGSFAHEIDIFGGFLKCSHPMDSFITLIGDQLPLLYCLLMEGTCMWTFSGSPWHLKQFFARVLISFDLFAGLDSLSKSIGHMPVVRGKTHQVGSFCVCILVLAFELSI